MNETERENEIVETLARLRGRSYQSVRAEIEALPWDDRYPGVWIGSDGVCYVSGKYCDADSVPEGHYLVDIDDQGKLQSVGVGADAYADQDDIESTGQWTLNVYEDKPEEWVAVVE